MNDIKDRRRRLFEILVSLEPRIQVLERHLARRRAVEKANGQHEKDDDGPPPATS